MADGLLSLKKVRGYNTHCSLKSRYEGSKRICLVFKPSLKIRRKKIAGVSKDIKLDLSIIKAYIILGARILVSSSIGDTGERTTHSGRLVYGQQA